MFWGKWRKKPQRTEYGDVMASYGPLEAAGMDYKGRYYGKDPAIAKRAYDYRLKAARAGVAVAPPDYGWDATRQRINFPSKYSPAAYYKRTGQKPPTRQQRLALTVLRPRVISRRRSDV